LAESSLDKEDIIKWIDESNDKLWNLRSSPEVDYDPIKLGVETLEKSIQLNYRFGIARGLLNKGMAAFIIDHKASDAIHISSQALEIFKELDDKKWIANVLLTQAILYTSTGRAETALYNALKGIPYYEENKDDPKDAVMAFYVTGTVFKDLKKYDEAESYYLKGIKVADHLSWSGRIFTGLSNIYSERGNNEEALELALKSLDILKTEKNLVGVSRALTDIGGIHKKMNHPDIALNYFFEALKIREDKNMRHFILGSYIEIAGAYEETSDTKNAIDYFIKAENLAKEISHEVRLSIAYLKLAGLYKRTNNLSQSIDYFEKYIALSGELNRKERENKVATLQNALLLEKEQEIERLKNVELKNANTLISEKNKEITDSIHYAKRIQKALMASDFILKENLAEYFVLYKPKDIVSGDFYWATNIVQNGLNSLKIDQSSTPDDLNNLKQPLNLFYLAVCDSTGHGVPGAFMSLLNITFLNEAINEKKITEPNEVFNHVRERLINAVSQDGARDGMDGILVCFDKEKNTLTYSAANNGPILKTKKSLELLPADKMPVGKDEKTAPFTLHTIKAEPGDTLYLITDGYADQFGGPKGKKFRYKQLEETICNIDSLPLHEQEKALDKKFEEWKGELEQVDDVLIIGIKL
jgi:serine phosphatase RsbU (regulator of sigma subunit)